MTDLEGAFRDNAIALEALLSLPYYKPHHDCDCWQILSNRCEELLKNMVKLRRDIAKESEK